MAQPINVYSTATEMLAALRARDISSVELVDLHLDRVAACDAALNAIPIKTAERARAEAQRADTALARGQRGALLGLPITLKESTQAAGLPQSAGIVQFKDYRPQHDGPLAAAIFNAGACLLGKTNIPVALGDWQADSPVYGRTNNPWDHTRTPGGSTGGGSAALAAGMTPLEIGSDIGGSIRVPGAYCGVYGHRPSETAIPREGAFPLADLPNPAALMGVQGPLARSADDLELMFKVIAGPVLGEDAAWRLELPQARHAKLRDFRVAVMPALPWVKAAAEMNAKVEALAKFLGARGAKIGNAMPEVDSDKYFRDYLALLTIQTSQGQTRAEREAAARALPSDGVMGGQAEGLIMDAMAYLALLRRRELARDAWRRFYKDWDVLIAPMALDVAFEHKIDEFYSRTLTIDNEVVPYAMNLAYPMWAIFTGQPSTAFPAGLSRGGLPLGLQAIGPYLEDRTTMRFAQLLEREWEGFVRPPGY